jgi:hypothetical protein
MLDEGLDLMARLWTGDVVEFHGKHFQVEPVRFTPAPFNGTKIPVWVGGAEVAEDPVAVKAELPTYEEAGTTWWIETARPPQEDWYKDLRDRISVGPTGRR